MKPPRLLVTLSTWALALMLTAITLVTAHAWQSEEISPNTTHSAKPLVAQLSSVDLSVNVYQAAIGLAFAQSNLDVVVDLSNNSSQPVTASVQITSVLPGDLPFITVTTSFGSCNLNQPQHQVECALNAVTVLTNTPIAVVTITLHPEVEGQYLITTSMSTPGLTDTNTNNNTSTILLDVYPAQNPSFSITGTVGVSGADILMIDPLSTSGSLPIVAIPATNLGLVNADEIDALSYGTDTISRNAEHPLFFSVREGASGIRGSAVEQEASCGPGEVGGDEFAVPVPGHNRLYYDENGTPCGGGGAARHGLGLAPGEELDALTHEPPTTVDTDGDRFPDKPVYFSLAPGSPTLTTFGYNPGDILVAVSTTQGLNLKLFASASQLGLQPSDNIDALMLVENGNGYLDLASASNPDGDKVIFSLDAPSASRYGYRPGDLLTAVIDPNSSNVILARAFPDELAGLNAQDDIDALKGNVDQVWRWAPFPERTPQIAPDIGCVVSPTRSSGPPWELLTSLPMPREGGFATVIGNRIYVGQGVSAFGDDTFTFIYDIPSNTWFRGAPAPIGRSEMNSACAEENGRGMVYVVGGRSLISGTVLSEVYAYDPVSDTWSARPPMPTPRAGLGLVWVPTSNTLFAIGGRTGTIPHDGTPLNMVEAFDVNANKWITKTAMPIAVMDIYATVYYSPTNEIYVFGGYDGSNVTTTVQVYDVATDRWRTVAPMLTPRSNAAAGVCNGNIYVIGGYDGTNNLTANEMYSPTLGTWVFAPPLPDPRSEFMVSSISTGDALYLIGTGIHGKPDMQHDRFNCIAATRGGYIAGHKYEDRNRNGRRDPDEDGIKDWKINLTSSAPPLDITIVTEADGRYQFFGLAPGVYTITESILPGSAQTQPGGVLQGYVVTITNAQSVAAGLDFGNAWYPLLLSGRKFLDQNKNSQWDGNEPPLGHWLITLTMPGGAVLTTTTDTNGYFEFRNPTLTPTPGLYTVTEAIPAGWQQTWPNNTIQGYTLEITSANWTAPWYLFGNATITATGYVEGYKYEDHNSNGIRDIDEAVVTKWPILLTTAAGNVITTSTGNDGKYQFYGLAPGTYTITEWMSPAVVTQTQPGAPLWGYTVTITGSQVITGLDFGNVWPSISGIKFYDYNRNGQQEQNEPPLAGWPISLTTPSGVVSTTTTGANGLFAFYNLPPGVYTVTEALPPGWQQTLPNNTLQGYTVGLPAPPGNEPWLPFGNVTTNTVVLTKFNDLNANKQRDPGEPPVPNVAFRVQFAMPSGPVVVTTTVTDNRGEARLFDLLPGLYTVTEATLPSDVTQTLPGPPLNGYTFTVQAGDVITLLFGNTAVNDLIVSKTSLHPSVLAGGQMEYDIRVTNAGPGTAFNVQITDTLSQPWGNPSLPTGCTAVAANIIRCDLGTLYTGDSRSFRLVAPVPPAALTTGVLTNTVEVRGSGVDTNPLNNRAQITTTVLPATDLAVHKIVQPEPVVGGQVLTYTIRVENRGPLDATGVQITDTLPAGLTPLSTSPGCTLPPTGSSEVLCSFASLPAYTATYITITARAPLVQSPLKIMNFVEASASSPAEANPTNNFASAYSTVLPAPVTRPEVFAMTPSQGANNVSTSVVITGQNFKSGLKAFLGKVALQVNNVTSTRIDAVVPAGLPDGTYDLTVENPDGQQATLLNAFTVFTPQRPPILKAMRPNQSPAGRPAWSMIHGDQMAPPFVITFTNSTQPTRTYTLGTWRFIDTRRVAVAIPASIPAGVYHLTLQNANGLTATLTDAYTITFQIDDLYADSVDFWVRPRTIHQGAGSPVTLGLNLHRMGGTQPLSNVNVSFYLSMPGGGAPTLIGSGTATQLAPDGRAPVTTTWSTIPVAGQYVLIAKIDPTHQITESNEYNNVITRSLTILPPLTDNTPPEVIAFTVDHGAQTTLDRQVVLSVTATDSGSGVAYVHYKEFRFDQGTHRWMLAQESGWLTFNAAHTQNFPWLLQPFAGLHYLQAWVMDSAGNVSLTPQHAFINYLPQSSGSTPAPPLHSPAASTTSEASAATILKDEVVIFRYRLKAGEKALVVLSSLQGDADLYVGSPDGSLLDKRETSDAVEQIQFTATVDGIYQIEVAGYTDAVYRLDVILAQTTTPAPSLAPPVPRPRPRDGLLVNPGDEPSDDVNLPGNPTASYAIYLPIVMR